MFSDQTLIVQKNKQKFFALEKYGLPLGKYAIGGSGPLGIRGIREINDIDILVLDDLRDVLIEKYGSIDDGKIRKVAFPDGDIEAFWEGSFYSQKQDKNDPTVQDIILNAEIIDGLPFESLEHHIYFKKKMGRPKDLEDLKLIEQWENNQNIFKIKLIEALKKELEQDKDVFALWLEGADSLGKVDQYSDLDIVLDVKDKEESRILSKIESILQSFHTLDLNWEAPAPTSQLRYKVFHIKDTSEHLLIDVNIQSHSRHFKFITGNNFEKPLVIFDKDKVINFEHITQDKLTENQRELLSMAEALFFQRSKVKKYILRKKYLEAFSYYQKYVLEPLIILLRIIYTPLIVDYGLIHISDHLPKESLSRLEKLYQINSLDALKISLIDAEKWFKQLHEKVIIDFERSH